MSILSELQNYKHDVVGKFKDIQTAVSAFGEDAFRASNHEVFHAIHEVLIRMIRTSNQTIRKNLKQEVRLVVTSSEAGDESDVLSLEGLRLRVNMKTERVTYYYHVNENPSDILFTLGRAYALLPIKELILDLEDGPLRKRIEEAKL